MLNFVSPVGLRISLSRQEAGLTVSEFSEKTGISEARIRALELGARRPKYQCLSSIATATGRSMGWFSEGLSDWHENLPELELRTPASDSVEDGVFFPGFD